MGVIKRVWNAFTQRDPPNDSSRITDFYSTDIGQISYSRPDRVVLKRGQERTILSSIMNRIAIDASALKVVHCRVDEEDRYLETIDSKLNRCFKTQANLDESARAFRLNLILSLLDEGDIAIVPTYTDADPRVTDSYDIYEMRVGKVVQWWPEYVKIDLYNDKKGIHEYVTLPKRMVALIENPLSHIMNDPNSTAKRLNEKLSLLDYIDKDHSSGKLNLLFQLPYEARTDKKKAHVENRRQAIKKQLTDDPYGIAYIDSTERVIQLNRSVENGLFEQVEYYTKMLMSQLGMTEEILNGKASEQELTNYYNMTIEPIISVILEEMKRKFLSSNAITRGESIRAFRDIFKMATLTSIANAADSLIRNEVLTSNDVRADGLGYRPSDDPKADQLANPNINPQDREQAGLIDTEKDESGELQLQQLDEYDRQLDELEAQLNHMDEDEDSLSHSEYKSKYYDPVKAHEYYEKTKAARGLYKGVYKTGNTLNEKGKEAQAYIKKRIDEEKTSKINAENKKTEAKIKAKNENVKKQLQQHTDEMNNRITALQEYLKDLPESVKKVRSANIKKQIDLLKSKNAAQRKMIINAYSLDKKTMLKDRQTANDRIKTDYQNTYDNEIEKLKSDSRYVKTKTKTKTSNKSTKKSTKKKTKKTKEKKTDYSYLIKKFWSTRGGMPK